MLAYAATTVCSALLVVLLAARFRGRFYAIFALVLASLQTFVGIALYTSFEALWPLWVYGSATAYLHLASLVWARLRPPWWRALVSVPAHFVVGGSMLALPWAIVAAFGIEPWLPWLPYALAAVGVLESVFTRETVVDLALDGTEVEGPVRRYPAGQAGQARPLRIVQITDPHLGPWMSGRRLRRICERAVAREPDLVVLTGDFLTMESHGAVDELEYAFEPLRALEGRVFACRGNHDLEAPDTVAEGLARVGARLLIDESAVLETAAGPVQIVGLDFLWRRRRERMAEVFAEHPRQADGLRLVLLHDPGAFKLVPEGEADLVLSGHTHGGQVGLVTLGLAWTPVWAIAGMPDHGFFARGRERLYVHRGTGHYGFPLRVGVPAEQSLLLVHRAAG